MLFSPFKIGGSVIWGTCMVILKKHIPYHILIAGRHFLYSFYCIYNSPRQEEKETTEDEMVGQGHRSDQHEFDPGGSGRQEGLAFSGPWGHEESDTT